MKNDDSRYGVSNIEYLFRVLPIKLFFSVVYYGFDFFARFDHSVSIHNSIDVRFIISCNFFIVEIVGTFFLEGILAQTGAMFVVVQLPKEKPVVKAMKRSLPPNCEFGRNLS